MNHCDFSAVATSEPREVAISEYRSAMKLTVAIPRLSDKKIDTVLDLTLYGKDSQESAAKVQAGDKIYVYGCGIRYNLETKRWSLENGRVVKVSDAFPIINNVVITGKTIRPCEDRNFQMFENGNCMARSAMSVPVGRGNADIISLVAWNGQEDRYQPAKIIKEYTDKGTGLTVLGRIGTSSWKDKQTGETRTKSEVLVKSLWLAPKNQPRTQEVEPQTTVAQEDTTKSLWSSNLAEPGLPELPEPAF